MRNLIFSSILLFQVQLFGFAQTADPAPGKPPDQKDTKTQPSAEGGIAFEGETPSGDKTYRIETKIVIKDGQEKLVNAAILVRKFRIDLIDENDDYVVKTCFSLSGRMIVQSTKKIGTKKTNKKHGCRWKEPTEDALRLYFQQHPDGLKKLTMRGRHEIGYNVINTGNLLLDVFNLSEDSLFTPLDSFQVPQTVTADQGDLDEGGEGESSDKSKEAEVQQSARAISLLRYEKYSLGFFAEVNSTATILAGVVARKLSKNFELIGAAGISFPKFLALE